MPYLSTAWQRRFEGKRSTLPDHPLRPPLAGATSIRQDATPPGGGAGGSDPVFMREDLLDRYGIEYAVLSSIQAGKLATLPNAGEAVVLARAFNDYFLNEWLTVDSRYRLAMCVAAHDPQEAAKEIRRIGSGEGVVAVFVPLLNILMGNRYYYPIYEAAEELALPILIHPTGTEGGFQTSVSFAGGIPSTYTERSTRACPGSGSSARSRRSSDVSAKSRGRARGRAGSCAGAGAMCGGGRRWAGESS